MTLRSADTHFWSSWFPPSNSMPYVLEGIYSGIYIIYNIDGSLEKAGSRVEKLVYITSKQLFSHVQIVASMQIVWGY